MSLKDNPQKLHQFNRGCLEKERYTMRQEADQVARRALENRKIVLFVYPCKFCMGYHLTSRPPGGAHDRL